MDFDDALRANGFSRSEERPTTRASRTYLASPNRYLTYYVHAYSDGTAIFSFEFAIADYLGTVGLQIGSSEELNQFLYPRHDIRGRQDAAWLAAAIEHVEALLAAVDLLHPEGGRG